MLPYYHTGSWIVINLPDSASRGVDTASAPTADNIVLWGSIHTAPGSNTRVSRSIDVLDWQQFRAMPLYLQFILALMLAYALAMGVLTALIATDGRTEAGVTLLIGVFVLLFALVVIPSVLGSKYTDRRNV